MKNRRLIVLCVIALSAGILFGAVTRDEAIDIALSDAGITKDAADTLIIHRDYDNGREEYEIEFRSGSSEWDYTIDVETGNITGYDYEVKNAPAPIAPAVSAPSHHPEHLLDRAALEEIALSDAGFGRRDVSALRSERDYDDGMEILEISFNNGGRKYEYDVLSTGEILKAEWELRREPRGRSDARLSESDAQRIALEAIGGDTDRIVVWEDRDDGRFVYECEADKDNYRYEIDIDGTGEILSVKRSLRLW